MTREAVVIFDEELAPVQGANLEKALKIRVMDRAEVIRDIFSTRTRSAAAKLQAELAQLRICCHGWPGCGPTIRESAAVSVFGVRGGPGRAQGGAGGSGAGGATEGVVLMVRMEGWRAKRFEA